MWRKLFRHCHPDAQGEAEYIVKLYAMADTLERSLVEQGVSEVPLNAMPRV
jgi:hypothetical protein